MRPSKGVHLMGGSGPEIDETMTQWDLGGLGRRGMLRISHRPRSVEVKRADLSLKCKSYLVFLERM
jgi:hypothetical protein